MKYLLILPGVLVLLVLIAVVRTLVSPRKTSNYQPLQTDEAEALRLAGKLSKMIQVDTTSHAGGDDPARFRAFHKTLAELFPRVFSQLEKTEIDGNLLFYWKGRSREKADPAHEPSGRGPGGGRMEPRAVFRRHCGRQGLGPRRFGHEMLRHGLF